MISDFKKTAGLSLLIYLGLTACTQDDSQVSNSLDAAHLITLTSYYPDQSVARRYQALPDSTPHGESVFYYPKGEVQTTVTYRRGIRHGPSATYFPDGAKESVFAYENGYPHGPYRWYYPGEKLMQEGAYQAGKLAGWVTSYYPDGTLESREYFQAGEKSGKAFGYHKNGALQTFIAYHEGVPALKVAYDSTGNYREHYGSVIAHLEHDPTKLLWDDLIFLNIHLAVPPGWKGNLEIIRKSGDKISIQKRPVDESISVLHYSTPHRSAPVVELILRARLSHEQIPDILLSGEQHLTILEGKELRYE